MVSIKDLTIQDAESAERVLVYLEGLFMKDKHSRAPMDRCQAAGAGQIYTKGNYIANQALKVTHESVPRSVHEALKSNARADWQRAIDKELKNMQDQGVWKVVDLPNRARTIGSRIVLDLKKDVSTGETKYKARLVAQGCGQRKGLDYDETFSPVARSVSSRMLLALAARRRVKAHKLDYLAAFLHSSADRKLYMRPPAGMKLPKGKVLLILKALYGLKQSGRLWNIDITKALNDQGWKASESDPCLFRHTSDAWISLHVDDVLLVPSRNSDTEALKKGLARLFNAKDLGIATSYLGLNVEQNDEGIKLSAKGYIETFATRWAKEFAIDADAPITTYNARRTPYDADISASDCPATGSDEEKFMQTIPFRKFVGEVQWIAQHARPDISFAVSQLAKVQSNPAKTHWDAAKRMYRYLIGSAERGIVYKAGNGSSIMYCDASWADGADKRRSTTGWVCTVDGAAISWESRLQKTVAMSSTEAEYMAISDATKEALWIRKLMAEIAGTNALPIRIKSDNKGAIQIAKHPTSHSRTKHIELRHFFVRDHVEKGNVVFEYVPTAQQAADILTKRLSFEKFRDGAAMLGLSASSLCAR